MWSQICTFYVNYDWINIFHNIGVNNAAITNIFIKNFFLNAQNNFLHP